MNYELRNLKHKSLRFILILSFLFFVFPFIGNAQNGGSISENLSIGLYPKRPGPNELVRVNIESYLVDLNRSEISWFLNGVLQKKGAGEKVMTFTSGNPGVTSEISIILRTDEGLIVQKSLTIRPAEVTLLWEAESYTPPFYKGKAYFPYEGTARVIAIPNIVTEDGRKLSDKEIVFTWYKNDRAIGDKSGTGANVFYAEGSIPLRPMNIKVEISSADSQYVAEKTITIKPRKPTVILYENNPLYGTFYNNAITDSYNMTEKEINFTASPYFFTSSALIKYTWSMNGIKFKEDNSNSVTLRNEGGSGSSFLSLRSYNEKKYSQYADNNFSINFGDIADSFSNN